MGESRLRRRADDINAAIRRSVEWEALDLVVVVVGSGAGQGTLDEYRRARDLWKDHGRPQLLVYVCRPRAEEGDRDPVRRFKEEVIADGIVPRDYSAPAELSRLLAEQVPQVLTERPKEIDPSVLHRARRSIFGWGALCLVLTVAAVYASTVRGFPDSGVTRRRVELILCAPPLLFATFAIACLGYHRLLSLHRSLWRSPSWTERSLYDAVDRLVPSFALPPEVRRRAPTRSSDLTTVLLLLLLIIGPPLALHRCLYHELLAWQFVVAPHET